MIRGVFWVLLWVFASSAIAKTTSAAGPGLTRLCFEATSASESLRASIRSCDRALADDELPVAERAATLVNRGILRMQAKKLPQAIADFDAAIKLRPETAEAYVNKGIALSQIVGREREALVQLSEGIARGPLRPAIAYYQRAVANEQLGRVREAYEDYSRAAELAPEWADPAEQLQRFQTVRKKTLQG